MERVLASRQESAFPPAELALDGWMEKLLPAHPALDIEERYRIVLRENRARDAAAGRTLDGPHLTDLSVVYAAKNIAAARRVDRRAESLADRSVLAHARLITEMTGSPPVLSAR